jgi:hypothetical protein
MNTNSATLAKNTANLWVANSVSLILTRNANVSKQMTAEKWFIVEGTDPAGRKFRGIYSEDETAELLRDETNQLIGEK